MKIGIVLPATPGYSETFFNNKIKGLQEHGYTVVLFVNSGKNKTPLPVKIINSPNLSGNSGIILMRSFLRLIKAFVFHFLPTMRLFQLNANDKIPFAKNIKSIITSSHILSEKLDWLHFGFGTMAIDKENVAQAIQAKMAVSFRGFDHYVYPEKNKNCYQSLFSKNVKYHVLSEGMKTDLIQKGILATQIEKITPAINMDLFAANLNTEKTDFLKIVTVARLHWIKGLDYTLEALALLKQKGIKFHYTIIGEGQEKERLQFLVHQLELDNEVTFAGKLNPEQVKNELQNAEIYLQYSHQEGFCNAVLEAQAMGKICIVSDADGLKENAVDTVTGFVIPKRNPLYLASKIMEVNGLSAIEKAEVSKNAMERIKDFFNIEKQKVAFIKFYEKN
jgi:glycosyltransferase involved in cell wall biosynthesis